MARCAFGRAFAVGALIALVASLCYVATWEVIYFKFAPDYLTKYQARTLEKAHAEGASEEAIAQKKAEMDKLAVMYRESGDQRGHDGARRTTLPRANRAPPSS